MCFDMPTITDAQVDAIAAAVKRVVEGTQPAQGSTISTKQTQMVQWRMSEPLGIVLGDCFVVRTTLAGGGQAGLTTIGGGRILGASSMRLRRRPWTVAALVARRDAIEEPNRWGALLLRKSCSALRLSTWAQLCFRSESEMLACSVALEAPGIVLRSPEGDFVHADCVSELAARVMTTIEHLHIAHPKRLGFPHQEIIHEIAAAELAPGQSCNIRNDVKPAKVDVVFQRKEL